MQSNETNLQAVYRVTVVIYGALVGSLVCYAAIVEILKDSVHAGGFSPTGGMRAVFFTAGIALVAGVKYLQTTMLAKSRGESWAQRLQKLQRFAIVAAALSEIPAILGVVLFVTGGARIDFYILLIMSLGMYAVFFPRLSDWKNWMGSPHRTLSA